MGVVVGMPGDLLSLVILVLLQGMGVIQHGFFEVLLYVHCAGESKGDRDCCFQHARRAWRFHRTLPNRRPFQQVCSNPLLPQWQSQVHAWFLLFTSFTFCCKLILMTAGGLQRLLHAADVRVGRFQHRCCCHDSQCALSPAAGHDACVKYF